MVDTPGAPVPTKFAHFVLRSGQPKESIQWWSTVLCARIVHQNEFVAFLTYDDEHHRLAIVSNPELGDNGRAHAGVEHVAFTYGSLDDLVTTYERLRDAGIMPILPINHGMSLSFYYADPDGNQVELQIDLATPEQATSFMESDAFRENPLGVVFDPEELVSEHRSGQRVTALSAYGPTA